MTEKEVLDNVEKIILEGLLKYFELFVVSTAKYLKLLIHFNTYRLFITYLLYII